MIQKRAVRGLLRDTATIVIVDKLYKAIGGYTNLRRTFDIINIDFYIGLTSTPLTNEITDIYSIVS